MNNPFKVGDKVMRQKEWCKAGSLFDEHEHTVFTVVRVGDVAGEPGVWLDNEPGAYYTGGWRSSRMRAAIAGVDYPLPSDGQPEYAPNTGHLSDGSSVQKHSAGGLYPVVIWHRDKKLSGAGKYDVGLTWPDQPDTVWFRDYDSAINVAEAIKESLK